MAQAFFPERTTKESPDPSREGNARPQMNTVDKGGGRKPHGWIGEKGTDTLRAPRDARPSDAQYVITTPNPNYNGITAHLAFTGGRALVYDEIDEKTGAVIRTAEQVARHIVDNFPAYSVSPELPSLVRQPDAPVRGDMNLVTEPRIGESGQTALDVGTTLDRPKAFVDLGLDGPQQDTPRDARDLGLDR